MSNSNIRITVIISILSMLLLAGAVFGVPLVMADGDNSPPPEPANYYGELEINGEPAPANVTITAELDGEPAGSITTGEDGTFGGSGVADEKLLVSGDHGDEAKNVEFYIEGAGYERTHAEPAITWEPNDLRSIQLQAEPDRVAVNSIDIEIADDTLTPDEETTWRVTAVFEDGTESEVTGSADAQSSDSEVVTVDDAVINAIDQGTTDIEVSFEGVTETVSISVASEPDDDDGTDSDISNGGGSGAGGPPATEPPTGGEGEPDEDESTEPLDSLSVSVELTNDSVIVDRPVLVPVEITNDHESEVETSVNISLNGKHAASDNVSLPANSSETVDFEIQLSDSGPITITVRAGGATTESMVSVSEPSLEGEDSDETPKRSTGEESDDTPDTPTDDEEAVEETMPGFSVTTVLVTIALLLLISSRRH